MQDFISTRKEKEKKIRNKKQEENQILLNYFVKAYSSAYIVDLKNREFEILHMNHDFQQVFTMNGNLEDMARFVENNVHPDDRELMRKMTDPDYVRERMKTEKEITFTLREQYNGEERTMHVLIIRGADSDNVAIGFMDVTAELEKEREISRSLEKANNAKRDFLSSMSHDIRTPMNAIIGMVDIALNNQDNVEKMVDSLHKIRVSGEHLISLINDVLDISAIESGKAELRPIPHSVVNGAVYVDSTKHGILNGKDLDFTIDQYDIIYPWIMIDEVRLTQILNNLLGNAVKYTPEGGYVRLINRQELDEKGEPWNIIIVSDSGIGMSEDFMDKMWDTFSRATDTRINKIQGAGLGLSIVKNLVDMMGGTIEVESELNKGTTFTVRLPITPAAEEDIKEIEAVEEVDLFNCHVLVAEDNEMNWEIVNELLSMNDVVCEHAENGKIAYDMFTSSPVGTYDAIFMDMQMPVMNGVESTKAIRASSHPEAKTIPIIAMTANAFTEDVQQCIDAGMNEHLSKPIDMELVMTALKTYVRK